MVSMTLLGLMLLATGEPATALTLDQIHLRDPFIFTSPEDGRYYLFGTGWSRSLPGGAGFLVYRSRDLVRWEGPYAAFTRPEGFESSNYWAPEVHHYQGKYYMFATFCEGGHRGVRILIADQPQGPYRFHSEGQATPKDWMCLDGTLFVDAKGNPWMVFCHEWVQVHDGEVSAMPLSKDLKEAIGEPRLLFKASAAPWGTVAKDRVTDGPFLHRTHSGALLMIWSSFGAGGYKEAVVHSTSGSLDGPWVQEEKPLYETDGGHGMFFHSLDGKLMLVLHQPNSNNKERPRLFTVTEKGDQLSLTPFQP